MEKQTENRFMDMGKRGGEGEMYGKSNMETCKIYSQREFAVWLRNSNRGSVSILEGWDGEGDGKEAQKRRDICIPMADSG